MGYGYYLTKSISSKPPLPPQNRIYVFVSIFQPEPLKKGEEFHINVNKTKYEASS